MKKVIFGGANSLDNYFARKDGAVDWLLWSKEVSEIMTEYWNRFDTVLMGRNTYEVTLKMAGAKNSSSLQTYVFSRTLKPVKRKGLEIVSDDVAEFVRKLKQEDGKDIYLMGGGLLAKPLFEADLIDEIGFNIHPVLLGSGIPLYYEMNRQINLELLDCRQLSTGCVVLSYRVKHEEKSGKSGSKRKK